MNKEELLEILNSKQLNINVFLEYAKDHEKEVPGHIIQFIMSGLKQPILSGYITEAYQNCLRYFIEKLEVNHIKDLNTDQITKYY